MSILVSNERGPSDLRRNGGVKGTHEEKWRVTLFRFILPLPFHLLTFHFPFCGHISSGFELKTSDPLTWNPRKVFKHGRSPSVLKRKDCLYDKYYLPRWNYSGNSIGKLDTSSESRCFLYNSRDWSLLLVPRTISTQSRLRVHLVVKILSTPKI